MPRQKTYAHSFCKLYNIASLEVPQVRHLERSRQTTGQVHCTAALRGTGVSNYVMPKNKTHDRKNTTRILIDMFIQGVFLRPASRRRRRHAGPFLQGDDDRSQPVYNRMQPACSLRFTTLLGTYCTCLLQCLGRLSLQACA